MNWQKNEFKRYLAQTSPEPMLFQPEKGEGVFLMDKNGKKYLDLISGISVSALGHCHPAVIEAVEGQCRKYSHTMVYGEFVLSPQVELAKKLCSTLPDTLDNVYFVNSGSEAVEGAIKLAVKYTGKREIISCYNAYHGSSTGALSLMSDEYYTQGYKPFLPEVKHIHFNELKSLDIITEKTAAVFIEPVQGEAGYLPADQQFLEALSAKCAETGCLLIFDEIQSGMGRTGKLWAFEHSGVIPDILLTAKGLGGGLPLGAFISSKKIMNVFSNEPILGHITTFGGNPISCAASLATLETIIDGGLLDTVAKKENLFRRFLTDAGLRQLTGKGLMLGLPVGTFEETKAIVVKCLEYGLITDWFLFETGKLRISPPLIISSEEIELACKIITSAFRDVFETD
ncbi:MAG: aspartate aminotransferase family protein [Saprospirales bacterium]|nr:MAG: aspartate aminotransferase family protein [Saprospirales bacterium]